VREHGEEPRAHPATTAGHTARRSRRRPAILTGTALVAAGGLAAAVLVFSASTSPPAYAVTNNGDGTVTVTLNDIYAITALNAELARDGIAAKVPAGSGFGNPWIGHSAVRGTANSSTYTITIAPREIPARYTAVVAVGESASGHVQLAQRAFPAPVPVCFNSTPTALHPIDMSHASPALKAAVARAARRSPGTSTEP
jgi:hypothetical protein